MGRSKPVAIATRTFENQRSAIAYFSAMLNRYSVGQRVNDEDAAELKALLLRHNEADEKIGLGVLHFGVMEASFNTKCFCVVRVDGTRDDFSYQRCVDRRVIDR